MSKLYHYCSNEKAFSILKNRNIRMSDIGKSNDRKELQLFFPELHREVLKKYEENPFPIEYKGKYDLEAMRILITESEDYWRKRFDNGEFSNFVACFSAKEDSLSQWRGYADDGRGCCIGFSKEALEDYALEIDILGLEKVEYLYNNNYLLGHVDRFMVVLAKAQFFEIDNSSLINNFILTSFSSSITKKSCLFAEEDEYRLFIKYIADKAEADNIEILFQKVFRKNLEDNFNNFLNNNIDFHVTNNDIIPFCPIKFDDFASPPVCEVILGPKNNARIKDVELLLLKSGYKNVTVTRSEIPYR